MRRSSVPFLIAATAYLALTIALTWPLVLHPRSLIPSDLGDPLLNIWIMWWNASTTPLTDAWWNAPQFYPFRGSLALSEHLLGLWPVTTPIIALTGEPVLAYNVAFLLSFVLCGLSAHFLAFTITRRHDVAAIAGVAFACAPYRLPQISHIQVLSAYWMPLALAGLHRYFCPPAGQQPRPRWLVLFAGAWLFQALACGYYFFFLSVLVALWLGWFAVRRGRARQLVAALFAWTVAAALLAPVLYGYWKVSRAYNLRRTGLEIHRFSADIASVLKAPETSRLWGWLDVVSRPEGELFPGLTVVLLSAVAIGLAWRVASKQASGYPRIARVLLSLGVAGAAISIARGLHGPFKLEIFGLRLMSVTSPEKPISVAALCFITAALLTPAIRAAWQQRSSLAFYALGALAMWLMALGPAPTLMNVTAIYKAPYAWLLMLPGADGVRVPARFWMLAVLCLGVTAALGVRLITTRWPRTAKWLPAAAVVGILLDGWPTPLPMFPLPDPRPSHAAADLRLDLPAGEHLDMLSLYRATRHGRPLINGYSGYFAPHYWVLRKMLSQQDHSALKRLAELGSIEIVVEHALDPEGTWRRFAQTAAGAQPAYAEASYSSYVLPRTAKLTPPLAGTSVPFRFAAASVNESLGRNIQDGDLYTRWHAGREQRRGDSFTVDLGSILELSGVEMLIGGYVADYPRELLIETSQDQQAWTTAWSGPCELLALSAALDHPRDVPLAILFPGPARYVRFTQTSADDIFYWSVAELRVLRK